MEKHASIRAEALYIDSSGPRSEQELRKVMFCKVRVRSVGYKICYKTHSCRVRV